MRFWAFERLCPVIWGQCGRTPIQKFELNGIHALFYWPAHGMIHTGARTLVFYTAKLSTRSPTPAPVVGVTGAVRPKAVATYENTRTLAHCRRHGLSHKYIFIFIGAVLLHSHESVCDHLSDDGTAGGKRRTAGPAAAATKTKKGSHGCPKHI